MIDVHCHILPEVDDGPKNWEIARQMCQMAAADGIEHIVATPHANSRYHYDREYLAGLVTHLQGLVGPAPRLSLGCDFHLDYDNLQAALAAPGKYTIADTSYLLVELSNYSVPQQVDRFFCMLGDRGITPVLTHPERNPILQQQLERVADWAAQGCLVQVTAGAFTGDWGRRALRAATWLLQHNAIHMLATDAHNLDSRPPQLAAGRDAAAELCGPEVARMLVADNPRALLSGQPVPYLPSPLMSR
jgi:protein-tyrosine phosphatase